MPRHPYSKPRYLDTDYYMDYRDGDGIQGNPWPMEKRSRNLAKELRKGKRPAYKEVYEELKEWIETGVYPVGSLLPSENELTVMYEYNRATLRHGLELLVQQGYIEKHPGKGSIVLGPKQGIGILSLSGTSASLYKNKLETIVLRGPELIKWPENFFYKLSKDERKYGCYFLERIRKISRKKILYEKTFLSATGLPRFTTKNLNNISLFDTLRLHYSIDILGGEQKIRALAASADLARQFSIKKGSALLQLERKIRTSKKDFFIYSSIFCNNEDNFLFGSF